MNVPSSAWSISCSLCCCPASACFRRLAAEPTDSGHRDIVVCTLFLADPYWTKLLIPWYSDDTSVAILERCERASTYRLHFHQKITADNSAFGGIHPARAISSHQQNLSGLVNRSLWSLPDPEPSPTCDDGTCIGVSTCDGGQLEKRKPHFISVTRGPGITAALACGLDTAKALSVAWQVPLVGVNHMQAHALTPRLDNALDSRGYAQNAPSFPYLSLLVSGGHTLLVSSKSLCEHSILASTTDIAVGDALDKMARSILPEEDLDGSEIMYGRLLERYAFAQGEDHREYAPPRTRAEEIASKPTKWGWALPIPLAATKDMSFSFAGLGSSVKRICDSRGKGMDRAERTDLARESMRVAFEHLATRVVRAMKELQHKTQTTTNLVLSGGVASNRYLRFMCVFPYDQEARFSNGLIVCGLYSMLTG